DDVLVARDGVTHLLVPGGDGGVGNGFGEYRYLDLGGHVLDASWSWLSACGGSVGGEDAADGGGKRVVDQLLLLFDVVGEQADGGRGRARAAGIVQFEAVGHAGLQVVPDLVPRALVLRLFLAPDDVGRLVEAREFLHQRGAREG